MTKSAKGPLWMRQSLLGSKRFERMGIQLQWEHASSTGQRGVELGEDAAAGRTEVNNAEVGESGSVQVSGEEVDGLRVRLDRICQKITRKLKMNETEC